MDAPPEQKKSIRESLDITLVNREKVTGIVTFD